MLLKPCDQLPLKFIKVGVNIQGEETSNNEYSEEDE
jgi:hypothetical protein